MMENLAGLLPTYKFLVQILLKEFAPDMIHDHYTVNKNMSITVYGLKREWLSNWLGKTTTYSLIDVLKKLTLAVCESERIDNRTAKRIKEEVTKLFMGESKDAMPLLRELLAIAIGFETYYERETTETTRSRREPSTIRRFPSSPRVLNWNELDDSIWDNKWTVNSPKGGKSTIAVEQQVMDEEGRDLGTRVQEIEFEDYLDQRYGNSGSSTPQSERGKF